MDQRISLVTLGVDALARERAFYEALGWGDARQPDDEVCFFQAGGIVFGLWPALGGHGAPGVGLAHNVRSPAGVTAGLAAGPPGRGPDPRPAAEKDWGGAAGPPPAPHGH